MFSVGLIFIEYLLLLFGVLYYKLYFLWLLESVLIVLASPNNDNFLYLLLLAKLGGIKLLSKPNN